MEGLEEERETDEMSEIDSIRVLVDYKLELNYIVGCLIYCKGMSIHGAVVRATRWE